MSSASTLRKGSSNRDRETRRSVRIERTGTSASLTMSWTSPSRAWGAGAGPGDQRLVIDIDSFVGEVHGYHKQGASYGYTNSLATTRWWRPVPGPAR